MGSFAYVAPKSAAEATALLAQLTERGTRAQLMAGGTDLLVQLKLQDREPRTIVDIKGLEETNRLETGAEETFIGAAIPSALLNENAALKGMFPGLIEAADLKGHAIGGAIVSDKHANFILNTGNATAADVEQLIHHVQDVVMARHGVTLVPEVHIVGEAAGADVS